MANNSMATPASIEYTPVGGTTQYINFNAVVSEDHEAKATITKYPVQEGMHVSNHSIRHNRQVVLEGVITNVQIEGAINGNTDYGRTPTFSIKAVFDSLVNSGFECTVVTNLGIYTPVVFSRFKTTQKAGMMDSMHFSIVGEEIVKVDTNNYTAPTPILWSEVTGPERAALVEELAISEIFVDDCDKLSQGKFTKGDDFTIDGIDESGGPTKTTYKFIGNDPSTGEGMYEVHFDNLSVDATSTVDVVVNSPCAEESFAGSLLAGVKQVSDCLLEEAKGIATEFVEDQIDTAMGRLQKSIYGAFYDTTTMGNEYGTMLAAAGVGCIVRGVTGADNNFPYQPGESLPSTDEIMNAASVGLGFSEPEPEIVTLTQIECACTSTGLEPEYDDFLNVGNIA